MTFYLRHVWRPTLQQDCRVQRLPACHIGLVLVRVGAARGAHAEAAFSDAYCCWGASMCAGFTHPPPPPLPPHTLWWL